MTRGFKLGDRVTIRDAAERDDGRIVTIVGNGDARTRYAVKVGGCPRLSYWWSANDLLLRPFQIGDAVKLPDDRRGVIEKCQPMGPTWDTMRYTVDVGDGGRVYATIDELEADPTFLKAPDGATVEELPAGCEVRRVELRPGDLLVITTPRRFQESEINRVFQSVRQYGERRGIPDLHTLILEAGADLRAVLGREAEPTEEAAK